MNNYSIDVNLCFLKKLILFFIESILKKRSEFSIGSLQKTSVNSLPIGVIDADLVTLIDRFFDLTYLNTIPMVNLLATAVNLILFN